MSDNSMHSRLLGLQKSLYKFALYLTSNKSEAEDLLQETSLQVLSNEDKYTEKQNFKGWTYTIMHNLFINRYRKLLKMKNEKANFGEDNEIPANISGIEADSYLQTEEINKLINSFPDSYRKPISLYLIGYSYNEISVILDIPIGTVKSRIHFMRKELQKRLKDYR